jgi:hypothetical protein
LLCLYGAYCGLALVMPAGAAAAALGGGILVALAAVVAWLLRSPSEGEKR